MTKIIRCECGHVVDGTSDEELVAHAWDHIRTFHPDMTEGVTDEALLGMIEIVA